MAPIMHNTSTLMKRDSSDNFSLYVILIVAGCIAAVLIASGIYSMYHGPDDNNKILDIPSHQRVYMREVRQNTLNRLAYLAGRPDLVTPMLDSDDSMIQ
ncbi:hypothetical protein N7495_002355 [Penicillium taxi]|uniref:uncharacterized protein n=1 Tax=Penicillium taxi TaxID=168475 RepID=UPI0025453AC0|nr:uncharacterized protein N7495_002355 [Penicillium taxi]KAJ5901827.1 hypothetical protein N7495_002355 [Penicillium taxi]